jgi:hypothetical protein
VFSLCEPDSNRRHLTADGEFEDESDKTAGDNEFLDDGDDDQRAVTGGGGRGSPRNAGTSSGPASAASSPRGEDGKDGKDAGKDKRVSKKAGLELLPGMKVRQRCPSPLSCWPCAMLLRWLTRCLVCVWSWFAQGMLEFVGVENASRSAASPTGRRAAGTVAGAQGGGAGDEGGAGGVVLNAFINPLMAGYARWRALPAHHLLALASPLCAIV